MEEPLLDRPHAVPGTVAGSPDAVAEVHDQAPVLGGVALIRDLLWRRIRKERGSRMPFAHPHARYMKTFITGNEP